MKTVKKIEVKDSTGKCTQRCVTIIIVREAIEWPITSRAWRCGDIPCYVSRDMLLSKDMKIKIYSIAGLYSSVGYVAEQCYIDQDIFVKPP